MMIKSFQSSVTLGVTALGVALLLPVTQMVVAQTPGAPADTVEWYDTNPFVGQPQTRLFDFGGNEITFTDGLVFQIIVDPGRNTDFAGILAAGNAGQGWGVGAENHMYSGTTADYAADDDVVLDQGNWMVAAGMGVLFQQATAMMDAEGTYMNSDFYFRWFNSAAPDPASAEAGIIFREAGQWRTRSDPEEISVTHSANLAYTVPANMGSEVVGDGWQTMPMVPEPGTFVLFGIGLLTVAARRKFRKTA